MTPPPIARTCALASGGKRVAGKGKKIGRPKGPATYLKEMELVKSDMDRTIANFQHVLKSGFVKGVTMMATRFPGIMEKKLVVAEGDSKDAEDARSFIIDRLLKFFSPEMITAAKGTPIIDILGAMALELKRLDAGEVIDVKVTVLESPVETDS